MTIRPHVPTWLSMTLAGATALAQSAAPIPTPLPIVPPAATDAPETVPPPAFAPASHQDAADSLPPELANRRRLEKPSAAGTMELTWLGHAGWVMRSPSGTTVLIDPWLTNPKSPHDFVMPGTIDAILVTHGHFDHVGEAAELSKKLHIPVIASYEIIETLGLSNGIGTNPGGTIKIKDLTIHAVQAVHSSGMMHRYEPDPVSVVEASPAEGKPPMMDEHKIIPHEHGKKGKHKGGKKGSKEAASHDDGHKMCPCMAHHHQVEHKPHLIYGGQAMGYVIDIDQGPTVYHAGDTDVFASMALIREQFHPTIGMLPIGGQYTMGPQGAALAAEILGLDEVLPMHYGTVSALSGTPKDLEKALEGKARVVAPFPGARVTYR